MKKVDIFLPSQVPAQKNAKTIAYNKRTGRPFIMSAKKVKDWQRDMSDILSVSGIEPIKGKVRVECTFYHKDARKRDLDNEFSSVLDLLKNNHIIEDDNCFIVSEFVVKFGGIDKNHCGVAITIKPLDANKKV